MSMLAAATRNSPALAFRAFCAFLHAGNCVESAANTMKLRLLPCHTWPHLLNASKLLLVPP